jgi:hypothetical protein
MDDNLHCESIEEEVVQAVRGGSSGSLVVSVSGKAAAAAHKKADSANFDELASGLSMDLCDAGS